MQSAYDAANRLIRVGSIDYTWDDNGNLLSDGRQSYTYDHAHRLVGVTQGADTTEFSYNGLGDRLTEGETDFVLDLNTGLTQVLADAENTNLYGNGRVMQQSAAESAYFLGDALGSVRQLTGGSGALTLTKAYNLYGEVMSSLGNGASRYESTGEWHSSTNLVYLRSRYYFGYMGRFLTD